VLAILVRTSLPLLLALAGSGCLMLASDGDELRTQAQARDRRIEQLEAQAAKNQQDVDQKLAELQTVLDKATAVLTRGNADVGAQVDQMRQAISTMEGSLDETRHKLDELDQQMTAQRADIDQQLAKLRSGKEVLDPSQIPADKSGHFKLAYDAYAAGEHEKSRALFREYVMRYHDDAKAGEAQYWIGASYTTQGKPATALGEYRKVIADFGKSSAVNVALFGMADAFYRLRACGDAKSALDALLKRKPEPGLTDRAKKLNKEISGADKSYCGS
jgi:TolA-binding protein